MGSGWGAGAKALCIATLSLVYSTAEYCAPVWCRSAHTRLIDSVLNDALRIVTGCLRPTPTDHLPVLSGIQPVELRRIGATLSLAYRGSLDPDHILYGLLSGSSDTRQVRLRSRRPFVPGARNLWTTLPDLASASLNGQITNRKRSTVKMLPGSVLLCPRPIGWSENNFFFEIEKSVVLKTCQRGKIYEKNWFWRVATFGGLETLQNVF